MKSLPPSIRTSAILLAFAMPLTLHAETSAGDDGGINLSTSDCGIKLKAPKHLCRNVDDDQPGNHDDHEKWDIDHDPSDGENDLQEMTIKGSTTQDGVKMFLHVTKGGEKVKFWKYANKTGALDPDDFEWDVPPPGREETFHVEGYDTGEVEFKATISCSSQTETVTTKVYEIDLDIDSLNDNGYAADGYTDDEDRIEASEKRQGKLLVAAPLEDFDNDGIPDHADMDITGKQFVPVQVTLKDPLLLASTYVTFNYPASVPVALQGGGGEMPTLPTRGLRLWKNNAAAVDGQQARTLGDFIPAGTPIPWSSVFNSGSSVTNSQILYLEYVEGEGEVTQGRHAIQIITTGTEIPLDDTVNVYLHPLFTLDAAIAPFASQPALPEDHEGAVPAHETDPGSLVIAPIKGRPHPGTRSELKLKITGVHPPQGQFSLSAENLDQLEFYDAPQGGNLVENTTWSASEFPGEITLYVASKPFDAQQQPQNGLLTFAYQPESASDPIWVSLDDQVRVRLYPAYSDLSIARYGNEADMAEEQDENGNATSPPHEMDPGGIAITGEVTDMGITPGIRARLTLAALTPDSMTGTYTLAANNLPNLVFYQNATGDNPANLEWTDANFAGGNKVAIYVGSTTLLPQSPPQIGTLTFTCELKPYDGDTSYTITDTVAVTLCNPVDLDVDSNNNEGFVFDEGSANEDKIEASVSSSEPGKIIAVPLDPDADKDDVPDFMDGFDGIGGVLDDPATVEKETKFVPMVIALSKLHDPEDAVIELQYLMSDPRGITASTTYTTSGFRIWTSDAYVTRSTGAMPSTPPATATGYFVPSGEEIAWKDLVANCDSVSGSAYDGPAVKVYIETVLTSRSSGTISTLPFGAKEIIEASAKSGSSGEEITSTDKVNIAVRCTGGVSLANLDAILVNDDDDNNDEEWDHTVDTPKTLPDDDMKSFTLTAIALDQPIKVRVSSEAMKGLGVPGTPATGGLIDGVYGDNLKNSFQSVPYTIDVPAGTTLVKTLFVEGQRNSETLKDVVIEATIDASAIAAGTPPCRASTGAELEMTVFQVDLDIDSNNNEGFTFTPGSPEEDRIESSASQPGKIIVSTLSADTNRDGIPDYENGVDRRAAITGAQFTPMKLTLPKPYDPATAEIVMGYDEAMPSGASPTSGMRIWRKDASTSRTTADDLIPNGTPISWDTLTGGSGARQQDLYIEVISTFGAGFTGQKEITATAKQTDALDAVDKVTVLLVTVEEVIETNEITQCTGYDSEENALMVPMQGSNKIKINMSGTPSAILHKFQFVTQPAGKLSIAPLGPPAAVQELTLSGTTATSATWGVDVRLEIDGDEVNVFEADVLKKITKTLEIHAITEQNDDVQMFPPGSSPGPNIVCVEAGANGFRDTKKLGDDQIVGDNITTGPDGVCDTTANNSNISPAAVPAAGAVQNYLNDKTWGNQANVHFTVTRSDHIVNYDLDRNLSLGDPLGYGAVPARPDELEAINNSAARNPGVHYNYYITDLVDVPIALTQYDPDVVMSQDTSTAPFLTIIAHECGHLLKDAGGHTDEKDIYLMNTSIDGFAGLQIQRQFWREANK